ncbi:MAG: hypothetical protein M3081_20140 [Gemmatimonadota bacterium]|nr:hypothetical protein [Gemmatimonadota bacterium]
MFGLMIGLAISAVTAVFGFSAARRFVRDKLRYVEAAQTKSAPLIAGIAAVALAAPIVWVLPLVGAGTAIVFGLSVGAGVASGAGDIKRGTGYQVTSGS